MHAILTQRHKTRTPHSELVFRLSPNNNIGESYKKFGISDTTSTLIAVKLCLTIDGKLDESVTNESVSKHLGEVVEGESVEIEKGGEVLGNWCDVEKVRKVYKLGAGSEGKKGEAVNGGAGVTDEKKLMESVICGTMALKGS
jgi:EKC/KEOPS complex subunit CGI121/TPRKB